MRNATKLIAGATACVGAAAAGYCACKFGKFAHHYGIFAPGNKYKYSVEETFPSYSDVMGGKRIVFLGSSVTYGMAARGNSFVDYLAKTCGVFPIKEAVSGTTLADESNPKMYSYVERMKALDPDMELDAFMCQLSTNDARQGAQLGMISSSMNLEDFDTSTTTGALEYVIAYVRETWGCPVFFYTSQWFDNPSYDALVRRLYALQRKWDFEILDMWNDEEFNAITPAQHALYMANEVHPTRAGYKLWWTPKFRAFFEEQMG